MNLLLIITLAKKSLSFNYRNYQEIAILNKKRGTLESVPLGKVRKVEGTTFPTWLDANKLAPCKHTNILF